MFSAYRWPTGAERPGPFDKLRVPNIVSMLSMVSQSNHEAWAGKKMNGLKEWIPASAGMTEMNITSVNEMQVVTPKK